MSPSQMCHLEQNELSLFNDRIIICLSLVYFDFDFSPWLSAFEDKRIKMNAMASHSMHCSHKDCVSIANAGPVKTFTAISATTRPRSTDVGMWLWICTRFMRNSKQGERKGDSVPFGLLPSFTQLCLPFCFRWDKPVLIESEYLLGHQL